MKETTLNSHGSSSDSECRPLVLAGASGEPNALISFLTPETIPTMSINEVPTAEVIESMASRLHDSAKVLESLAKRMRETKDLELAGDAANVIANLMPNLRLDLLVTRPLKAATASANRKETSDAGPAPLE